MKKVDDDEFVVSVVSYALTGRKKVPDSIYRVYGVNDIEKVIPTNTISGELVEVTDNAYRMAVKKDDGIVYDIIPPEESFADFFPEYRRNKRQLKSLLDTFVGKNVVVEMTDDRTIRITEKSSNAILVESSNDKDLVPATSSYTAYVDVDNMFDLDKNPQTPYFKNRKESLSGFLNAINPQSGIIELLDDKNNSLVVYVSDSDEYFGSEELEWAELENLLGEYVCLKPSKDSPINIEFFPTVQEKDDLSKQNNNERVL